MSISWILKCWSHQQPVGYGLLPFAWLFQGLIWLRRIYYIKKQTQFDVPVIVVGNITVGGTGKTPLVAALAQILLAQGFYPGIVMRGYKSGLKRDEVALVTEQSIAAKLGDEPVLLRKKTGCPVMIGVKRVQVVSELLARFPEVDVVLSDDGLQHYALGRDIEIAVIGRQGLGNGFCLPAGPLREPLSRLNHVDFIISENSPTYPHEWQIGRTLSSSLYQVRDPHITQVLSEWRGKTAHAVAGIGDPNGFFDMLRQAGIHVIAHPFPDHYVYKAIDLKFNDNLPILMTEKDAVKCEAFASSTMWAVPLEITLPIEFQHLLIREITHGQKITRYSGVPALQAAADLQEREE